MSALILLEKPSTEPEKILSFRPENLTSTGKFFFIAGAKDSGIFKSA